VSQGSKLIVLAAVLVTALFTHRYLAFEDPPLPGEPMPHVGVDCFRAGGEPGYCRCLDRLESARESANLPPPPLPDVDHPVVKYAVSHPRLFPIINGDTVRCLEPPPADQRVA
jgi:hypothetical protein